MPRRRGLHGAPRDYLVSGQWPDGRLQSDAPMAVVYAAQISERLASALSLRRLTNTEAARQMEIARQTLQDVLGGHTFPDMHTLAKGEEILNYRLWPGQEREF